MLVSIGILAHNEAPTIQNILGDLANQSLLSNENVTIDIHVVANGCTDKTVDVSQSALSAESFQRTGIKTFVHNLRTPGKANAWNELIHVFASHLTEFIFLMDADISIRGADTLQLMLDALCRFSDAAVAVDESVKDISLKLHKTTVERLVLAASGTAYETRNALAGGLYCARFSVLTKIWMPIGLPSEDGFLRAMILTTNFSKDEDLRRLVFVEGAYHIFEADRNPFAIYRHNVRIALGTGINALLFKHFRQLKAENVNASIADYIRTNNQSDKDWINAIVKRASYERYFLMEGSFAFRRLSVLALLPLKAKLRKVPIAFVGIFLDIVLFFRANALLRRGIGAGYW